MGQKPDLQIDARIERLFRWVLAGALLVGVLAYFSSVAVIEAG
jgi:hypothetical protein